MSNPIQEVEALAVRITGMDTEVHTVPAMKECTAGISVVHVPADANNGWVIGRLLAHAPNRRRATIFSNAASFFLCDSFGDATHQTGALVASTVPFCLETTSELWVAVQADNANALQISAIGEYV